MQNLILLAVWDREGAVKFGAKAKTEAPKFEILSKSKSPSAFIGIYLNF